MRPRIPLKRWSLAIPIVVLSALVTIGVTDRHEEASASSRAQASAKKKKRCQKKKRAARKRCLKRHSADRKKDEDKKKDGDKAPGNLTLSGCPTGVVKGLLPVTVSGTATPVDGTPVHLEFIQFNGAFAAMEVDVSPDAGGAWSFSFTPNLAAPAPPNWDETLSADYEGGDETADDQECTWQVG